MFKFFSIKKVVLTKEDYDKLIEDNNRRKELLELTTKELLENMKTVKYLEMKIEELGKKVYKDEK